jgi:hypothetical protein
MKAQPSQALSFPRRLFRIDRKRREFRLERNYWLICVIREAEISILPSRLLASLCAKLVETITLPMSAVTDRVTEVRVTVLLESTRGNPQHSRWCLGHSRWARDDTRNTKSGYAKRQIAWIREATFFKARERKKRKRERTGKKRGKARRAPRAKRGETTRLAALPSENSWCALDAAVTICSPPHCYRRRRCRRCRRRVVASTTSTSGS